MKLVQGDDMWVRGFYYFDNNEVRGRVATRYIQKNGRKILSGYWFKTNQINDVIIQGLDLIIGED